MIHLASRSEEIAGSASVDFCVQMEFENCLWTRLVSEINPDESINVRSAPSPSHKMVKSRQFSVALPLFHLLPLRRFFHNLSPPCPAATELRDTAVAKTARCWAAPPGMKEKHLPRSDSVTICSAIDAHGGALKRLGGCGRRPAAPRIHGGGCAAGESHSTRCAGGVSVDLMRNKLSIFLIWRLQSSVLGCPGLLNNHTLGSFGFVVEK